MGAAVKDGKKRWRYLIIIEQPETDDDLDIFCRSINIKGDRAYLWTVSASFLLRHSPFSSTDALASTAQENILVLSSITP